MCDHSHYRQTPEWSAVQTAVANLVDSISHEKDMLVDIELSVSVIPKDMGDELIGGYMHFASSPHPHISRGLLAQAEDYWAMVATSGDRED